MNKLGTNLFLVFMLVFALAIGSNTAIAAKPVGTSNVVLTSIVGMTATFDVEWNKYPAYRSAAYAQCYLYNADTDTYYYSGYMIGMGDVINDGKTHRAYSATGCTVVFGQNALISPNIEPISGKYCKITITLFDRKDNIITYAQSNVLQIP